MKCQTIQDVINRLTQMIEECKFNQDPRWYFAALYRKVTIRVQQGIANHEFDNGILMEKLDVLFANRYIEAYEQHTLLKPISSSWKISFDACKPNKHIVLQHILAGINAHINLDLGIAAVETAGNGNLQDLQKSFNQINQILADMIDDVKADLGRIFPIFKWLMPLAKQLDEKFVQFSISRARDGAWLFAQLLKDNAEPIILIQAQDKLITNLGYAILNPGKRLSILLCTIRTLEGRTVSEKIGLLEQ